MLKADKKIVFSTFIVALAIFALFSTPVLANGGVIYEDGSDLI